MASQKKPNDPRTLQRARQLRKDATVPERFLWGLRNRRLAGLRFPPAPDRAVLG